MHFQFPSFSCVVTGILITGPSSGNLYEHVNINHLCGGFRLCQVKIVLGLQLQLVEPTLESIKTFEDTLHDRFTAVLRALLRGNGCNPITHSHLVNALEVEDVGLP